MKVRITKSSKPTYWYANLIGEVFDVPSEPVKMYGRLIYKQENFLIDKADCELVRKRTKRPERKQKREFRVGDRVRVVRNKNTGFGSGHKNGTEGVITLAQGGRIVQVESNGKRWFHRRSELDLIESKPTYTNALREKLRDLIKPEDMDRAVKRIERLNRRYGMEAKV